MAIGIGGGIGPFWGSWRLTGGGKGRRMASGGDDLFGPFFLAGIALMPVTAVLHLFWPETFGSVLQSDLEGTIYPTMTDPYGFVMGMFDLTVMGIIWLLIAALVLMGLAFALAMGVFATAPVWVPIYVVWALVVGMRRNARERKELAEIAERENAFRRAREERYAWGRKTLDQGGPL